MINRIMAWRDRRRHDRELVEWCHSHRLVWTDPTSGARFLDVSVAELRAVTSYAAPGVKGGVHEVAPGVFLGFTAEGPQTIAPGLTLESDDDGPETAPSLSRQNAVSDPRPEQQ